jgi:hypothetical protein
MNHLLEWNNLDESANYLTLKSGREWTPRMVLDVGEKEELIIRFVVPANVKAMAGDAEEWIGDQPVLMSNSIAELLRGGKAMIGFVPFPHPITKHKTILELKPRPTITLDDVRVGCKDLVAYETKEKPSVQLHETVSNQKKIYEPWDDSRLEILWKESIQPGATMALLAAKYGISRQRIGILLKKAREKNGKSESPFSSWNKPKTSKAKVDKY